MGYIGKGADPDELLAAIHSVANGGRYLEREIVLDRRFDSPLEQLTARELDIVRLLGAGKTLSVIADALGVAYSTVASTCGVIKGKLGVPKTADLIRLTFEMRQRWREHSRDR